MKVLPNIYDPDKSIEVYKKTEAYFITNPELKTRIEELGWAYHTMGMIIPQTLENFWSGHNFPFTESWEELQISFNLVCFGLYKQAFVSLRSSLELGLLSVYYNINDDGHNTVKEWLKSKNSAESNTPRTEKIWKILLSNKNIEKFNNKHNLKTIHNDLGYLHNYIHTKGMKYSNRMGLLKSNFQTFEPEIVEKWIKTYTDILSLVCTLHLLKYPIALIRFDYSKKFGIDIPSFGGLEEYDIEKITKILPENYLSDIEEIANEDKETQQTIQEISEFQDMTEEQLEEQIIRLEKLFIENGEGFENWLERQKTTLKLTGREDFDDKTRQRIEILKEWAIENEFLESKSKRLGWDEPPIQSVD